MPLSQFSFKAYAHLPVNPPSPQLVGFDIDLNLTNTTNVFQMQKVKSGAMTEYNVRVVDPRRIGVESDDQTALARACQNFALGANLTLTNSALSIIRFESNKPEVITVPSEIRVEEANGSSRVFVNASVGIRTEVTLVLGQKEDLDERKTVEVIQKVNRINRFSLPSATDSAGATLINALHEFEAAMSSLDRLLMFKHLYNSLELTANADGRDRGGSDLDARILSVIQACGAPSLILSRVDAAGIANWKGLYNRTKHIARDEADVRTFVSGMESLPIYIELMRPCCARTLVQVLR